MQYPHRIRLRGPWECLDAGAQRRATMPCAWTGAGGAARQVGFTRRFGYPGTIDAHERVWLMIDDLHGTWDIALNGTTLATGQTAAFAADVTGLLAARNRLELTAAIVDRPQPLGGEVALEVRCTAYLDEMQAAADPDGAMVIRGVVRGTADGPLELYALADGEHVHYQTIEARPAGTPFRIEVPRREEPVRELRVELISIATIWYAWMCPV